MKYEKTKWGAVGAVLGAVTENWGLKLLALVLAIAIYYAIKPEAETAEAPSERIKFEKVES